LHLDPRGDRFTDWTPTTDNPRWDRYLHALAEQADQRRDQLGDEAIANPPQWALESLGPVPADLAARAEWRERATTVAAHRELTGHTDETTAIGAPPAPGQVEAYASWRASWRALDRPDTDRDEVQMSDGQLRMRVRAYEREQTWAPPRVANQLAGTQHAITHHRQTAELKTAEATAAAEPTERDRLVSEAADASALADTLESTLPQLRRLDDRWATWFSHTSGTRAAHDGAHAELANRNALTTPPEERVTAAEWAAAREEVERAEDAHREITEHDLTDDHELPHQHSEVVEAKRQVQPVDVIDLRELTADEDKALDEDTVYVPTAAESSAAVRQAERALAEIRHREAADAAREATAEEYTARVTHWHTRDHASDTERTRDDPGLVSERADHG
jgi:hypothetical protein